MKKQNRQEGVSLVEMVIVLAVAGLLMVPLGFALRIGVTLPARQSDKLSVAHDLEWATLWLTRDANSAEDFTLQSSPAYGYFVWLDRSGAIPVAYKATYSFDTGELRRVLTANDVVQSTTVVMRGLAAYGDVTFAYNSATRSVGVDLKSTFQSAIGSETATIDTHKLTAALRPRSEPLVAPPGQVAVPTPLPGTVVYYVAAGPTILVGQYVSGNASSLNNVDSNYFVVNSVLFQGSRYLEWTVESQTITSPSTIGQLEVRYTGKSSANNVPVQFWVKSTDLGFNTSPDSAFTFTSANTDTTSFFYLDAAALAYVNNSAVRKVTLKVRADATQPITLSSNQIIFSASP